jgi:hypothetical protein
MHVLLNHSILVLLVWTLHLDPANFVIRHYHGSDIVEHDRHSPIRDNLWDAKHLRVYAGAGYDVNASKFKSSDIDIFLYGLSSEQAMRKIEHILAVLGRAVQVDGFKPRVETA